MVADGSIPAALADVLDGLAAARSVPVGNLMSEEVGLLGDLGIQVNEGVASLGEDIELLSEGDIRRGLWPATTDWLRELTVRVHIDSTNTTLLERARGAGIDGCVLTAEVQTGGRGRRGRGWLSPYGRNLAVSLGFAVTRPLAELGALSLATGVAVRRALLDFGLSGVELKWPNDILLDGRKLAGILIELVRATSTVEVVIGIGVNVGSAAAVAPRVDQPVADVAEQIGRPSRSDLLARIVNHVVATCRDFDVGGFEPFRAEWEAAHHHQGSPVVLQLPGSRGNPGETVEGTALGVALDGSLRIDTGDRVREFSGGEVTLRRVPTENTRDGA